MTKIEELKFALLQATPGEWDTRRHATPDYAPQHGVYAGDSAKDLAVVFREADSDFIALAHNLMPQILEAMEVLKAVVPLMDIAFNYDGDVFGRQHNNATDVYSAAECVLRGLK